uniref:Uncharacterized protein n=1 Tax=Anguilla anguilla TaxID=7936 RepID=A0A0E9PL90_ANGAN
MEIPNAWQQAVKTWQRFGISPSLPCLQGTRFITHLPHTPISHSIASFYGSVTDMFQYVRRQIAVRQWYS